MDLDELSKSTSLPIRRLRYVLEHGVLPGAEKRSKGHRITRQFTPFESFGIACAAALLDAGLRRPVVAQLVRQLTVAKAGKPPLLLAFDGKFEWLEVGDSVNLRFVDTNGHGAWIQIATAAVIPRYSPTAAVCLNIARLRRAVLGPTPQ